MDPLQAQKIMNETLAQDGRLTPEQRDQVRNLPPVELTWSDAAREAAIAARRAHSLGAHYSKGGAGGFTNNASTASTAAANASSRGDHQEAGDLHAKASKAHMMAAKAQRRAGNHNAADAHEYAAKVHTQAAGAHLDET